MGKILLYKNVKAGTNVTPPTPPTYADSNFTGWSTNDYKNVQRDLAVETVYELKTFTVTFTEDGRYITSVYGVAYGQSVQPPVMPLKEGYNFVWKDSCDNITSDKTIDGSYTRDTDYHFVKFIKSCNGKEKEISNQIVRHGESATPPSQADIDIIISIDTSGWIFKGWDKQYTNIITDVEIRTVYEKEVVTQYIKLLRYGCDSLTGSPSFTTYPSDVNISPSLPWTPSAHGVIQEFTFTKEGYESLSKKFMFAQQEYETGEIEKPESIHTWSEQELFNFVNKWKAKGYGVKVEKSWDGAVDATAYKKKTELWWLMSTL